MSIRNYVVTPRARRALAAATVVLAVGALVLLRSSVAAGPQVPMDIGKNGVRFSGPGVEGSFSLSQSKVLTRSGEPVLAELRFASVAERDRRERAPLALALVLDTSGSMQGDKLEQARSSVLRLVDSMRDSDEVALVRYDSRAELIQPLARLGNVRQSIRARVLEMGASGGTNIPGGLSTGIDALRHADHHRVKRLVLVSDGLDSSRHSSETLARDSASRGTTVSALGIGLDFDEAYLAAVARVGRGNFGFVQDGNALARFLDRELNETASTTIRNAIARLRLPAGMHFVRAIGGEARVLGSSREVELQLGSLFAGDERRIVMELSSDARPGEVLSIDGEVEWTDVDGRTTDVRLARLDIGATDDMREVEQGRDHRVYARCASALASLRSLEAAQAYAEGDQARADAILSKNLTQLRTAASAAPEAEAKQLRSQIRSYEQRQEEFAAAAPASEAGRTAAKQSAAEDSANLSRSTY